MSPRESGRAPSGAGAVKFSLPPVKRPRGGARHTVTLPGEGRPRPRQRPGAERRDMAVSGSRHAAE